MADDFTSGFLAGQGEDSFGGGGMWIILIIFALIFGWGGNGFGGNRSATDGYILTSDFANIERKIDGVNNGICSLGYDQLGQMNGINSNIANLGLQMQSGFNAANVATLQSQNALSSQLASVVEAGNANYRALNDKLTAMEIARKDERIAEQAQRISALELSTSQCAQNAYLINQLRPSPVPAYNVAAPYYCNSGCGCM